MGHHVARLRPPYDFRKLVEAYVYTRRKDFVHADFDRYFHGLLTALEKLFGVRMSVEGVPPSKHGLWGLFGHTVSSLLAVGTPWDGYLEAGLLIRTLEETGEPGQGVLRASRAIGEAAAASAAAHRELLAHLFVAIFGEKTRVVASEELREAGVDDSREPDIADYWDHF